ncbi:hypothetical protein evm_011717 [Chilo suppressalis]|nr:hypothetical protein evm_011717 [Chilo suppressalis]
MFVKAVGNDFVSTIFCFYGHLKDQNIGAVVIVTGSAASIHTNYFSSTRESYGHNAIGYVQIKRDGELCTVKSRVTPEHKLETPFFGSQSFGSIKLIQSKVKNNLFGNFVEEDEHIGTKYESTRLFFGLMVLL